jgi:hypothetical protein
MGRVCVCTVRFCDRGGASRRGGQAERDAKPAVFSAPGMMGAEVAGGWELRARIGRSGG